MAGVRGPGGEAVSARDQTSPADHYIPPGRERRDARDDVSRAGHCGRAGEGTALQVSRDSPGPCARGGSGLRVVGFGRGELRFISRDSSRGEGARADVRRFGLQGTLGFAPRGDRCDSRSTTRHREERGRGEVR